MQILFFFNNFQFFLIDFVKFFVFLKPILKTIIIKQYGICIIFLMSIKFFIINEII